MGFVGGFDGCGFAWLMFLGEGVGGTLRGEKCGRERHRMGDIG